MTLKVDCYICEKDVSCESHFKKSLCKKCDAERNTLQSELDYYKKDSMLLKIARTDLENVLIDLDILISVVPQEYLDKAREERLNR